MMHLPAGASPPLETEPHPTAVATSTANITLSIDGSLRDHPQVVKRVQDTRFTAFTERFVSDWYPRVQA